ncbi:MAG: general secretion pathway protein GspK [Methylomonas sp.]|nr:MAG: general secretion pathway protein GspK [Methylomonas sp.]
MQSPIRLNMNSTTVNRQRGLALVIVIWILTLLTLMAGSFAMSMRRESSVSYAIASSAKAQALADSGVIFAQFNLTQSDVNQRWRANGAIYEIIGPESRMRMRIFSEAGKVDINTSSEQQLEAVLSSAVPDDWQRLALLNAILDWRDADDDTRTQGAEKRQYRRAGLTYGPSNAAFQSLEELQQVLGMTEAIYTAIQGLITVYSGQPEIDQQQAAPELLTLLAEDLKRRNIQDPALQNRLQARDDLNNGLENPEQAGIGENQTYTIIVEVQVRHEAAAGLEAVVRYQGQDLENLVPFETLDWKQNLQATSLFNSAMEHSVITIQDEFRYDD